MIFHHSTFPIIVWLGVNFAPGGHTMFVGVSNTFFHVILFGIIIAGTLWPHIKGAWFTNAIALTQVTIINYRIINRLSRFTFWHFSDCSVVSRRHSNSQHNSCTDFKWTYTIHAAILFNISVSWQRSICSALWFSTSIWSGSAIRDGKFWKFRTQNDNAGSVLAMRIWKSLNFVWWVESVGQAR